MRATDNGLIQIPLTMGMNRTVSERLAPQGTLRTCQNTRAPNGEAHVKRANMAAIADGAPVADATKYLIQGNGTTSFIEKPCFAIKSGAVSLIGTTSGQAFALNGIDGDRFHIHGCFSTAQPAGQMSGFATTFAGLDGVAESPPSVAVNSSGYVMTAVVDGNTSPTVYVEDPNGVRVFSFLGTGTKIQAFAVGATFFFVIQDGTALGVRRLTFTDGVADLSGSASVGTLTSSSSHWDTTSQDGAGWYLAHQSGASTMRVDKMSDTSSTANATFAVTGTVPVSLWQEASSARVWVGYYNNPTVSGDVRYQVLAGSNLASVLAETTLVSAADIYGPPLFGKYRQPITGASDTAAALYVFRDVPGSDGLVGMDYGVAYSDGTAATTPETCWNVLPISKPDNYHRVWVLTDSTSTNVDNQRAALLRIPWNAPAEDSLPTQPIIELASPEFPKLGTVDPTQVTLKYAYFSPIARSSTYCYFGFPYNLMDVDGAALARVAVYRYTVGDQECRLQALRAGPGVLIGGQPTELFGQPVDQYNAGSALAATSGGGAEVGYLHPPIITSAVQATGSGIGAGTYSYRAVYQWVDKYGRRHRSAPSRPVSVTVTEDDKVNLRIAMVNASQRQTAPGFVTWPSSVLIYRTLNGGTEYKLVGSSFTSSTVATLSDDMSDSDAADEETLYTDGGVLPNVLAPSCRFMAMAEDRLWCGGLWDDTILECSKVSVPFEPWQFTGHPSHQVQLPGKCTGLAYQDGQVAAFLEDGIYLTSGDGPNDQGIGSFPSPRKYVEGIGCVNARSIVATNSGIYFQGAQGLYRIPRGFGPLEFVGATLGDLARASGYTCLGAISYEHNGGAYVRWMFGAIGSDPTGSAIYTYDETNGNWYTDTIAVAQPRVLGVWDRAVLIGSLSSAVESNPIQYERPEGDGSGLETGGLGAPYFPVQLFETNWIYPFGPGGWGHVRKAVLAFELVYPSISGAAGTLGITVQTDNNDAQTKTWAITGAAGQVIYRGIDVKDAKCTGVQVSAYEVSSVVARGFRFLGLILEVESSSGVRLLAGTERG